MRPMTSHSQLFSVGNALQLCHRLLLGGSVVIPLVIHIASADEPISLIKVLPLKQKAL